MGQMFRTLPVGLGIFPALYQLSIRSPGQQFAEFSTYTFPITPSQLRTERSSLSSYVDTQGPASSQGVTRVMDTYGLAPPVFTIEGTTGYDRHMSDGYLLTGIQSMQLLAQFLAQYATLNQGQRLTGNPKYYSLEFYDYYGNNFWVVEPIGPQVLRQANDRPTLIYYRFRWAAVRPAGVPVLGELDALANLLATPAQQAAVNAARTVGGFLTAYGPSGPVSSALGAL